VLYFSRIQKLIITPKQDHVEDVNENNRLKPSVVQEMT